MNILLLYLILLKATMTSFSGMASLPSIREDLVVRHGVLTDRQLSAAVAAGRIGPGPIGLYVVSVGYFAGGVPGAVAGWAALITPAFVVIPLMRWVGRRVDQPRVRATVDAVTTAAAGLIVAAAVPLARDSLFTPFEPIPWVEAEDLLQQGSAWVPFELVHADATVPRAPGGGCFVVSTNGLASGNSLDEATLVALFEVIERDSHSTWRALSPRHCRETRVITDSVSAPAWTRSRAAS